MKKDISKPKIQYTITALIMLIFFVISFISNILNSIIVDVKTSFDLSLTLTGLLPFSFFIAYGVMSIPAGFLSERYNDKKLLAVSFLVMMIASLDFVIFPGYVVFSVTLFCLGCCMAVLQVVINPMLRVAGGEEHFAFNSVLAQVGSLSGILCIGITGAAIVPFIIGWIGELTNLKTGMFFLLIPMGFVLSIGFWASPFVNNKTISLKKLNL